MRMFIREYGINRIQSKHLCLLLLVPIFIISYPLLQPGAVVHGDYPYGNTLYYGHKVMWLWMENGSYNSFESLVRLPIIGTLYLFVLSGASSDVLSKFMIIIGFFSASFSFYFAFIFFFRDKFGPRSDILRLRLAALLGSIFYTYNAWSITRVGHWYFWLGYCLLPFFFISLICSFRSGLKWKYLLVAVGTWSIATSTPHMFVFYGLILGVVFSYYFLRNLLHKRGLTAPVRCLLLIVAVFSLVNMYWIYPFVLAQRSISLGPSIVVTEETTDMLSRDSGLMNVVRLLQDWVQNPERSIKVLPESPLFPMWLVASFFFPILAFSSFLLVRKDKRKYVLAFGVVAFVGIFLAQGSQGHLNDFFYSVLLFQAPIISKFGWTLRDPDKWTFLIAFGYSFLIGITSYEILSRLKRIQFRRPVSIGFFLILLGSMMLYSYPGYRTNFDKNYNPIVIPHNVFDNLNRYLLEDMAAERVFFMPLNYNTDGWRDGHIITGINQFSSSKPHIQPGSPYPNVKHYYEYLIDAINLNKTTEINNFMYPLGTRFLVYENDTTDAKSSELLEKLSALNNIKNTDNVGFFDIFRLNGDNEEIGQVNVPDQNIAIAGGGLNTLSSLNSIESFSTLNSTVVMLDQYFADEKYNQTLDFANALLPHGDTDNLALSFVDDDYIITPFDTVIHHDPGTVWSKASTMDPLHGDFHPYTNDRGIDIWEFDYGKGLVLTWAKDNLTLPIDIKDGGNYDLYMRYLKNQYGGAIKLSIDNKPIREIITKDQINSFSWENVGRINLTRGNHILSLENLGGFNAVNIFAILPDYKTEELLHRAHALADRTRNIFLLEGESDFYTKGTPNGFFNVFNASINGTPKVFTGQFKVPKNTDLMSLELLAKKIRPDQVGSYSIKNLEIKLAEDVNSDYLQPDQASMGPAFINNFDLFQTAGSRTQKVTEDQDYLRVELGQTQSRIQRDAIKTEPFLVQPNQVYNYVISIEGTNIDSLTGYAHFLIDDRGKRVQAAHHFEPVSESNGRVLSLSPGSEIFSKVDILKPSHYTIALKVKTCDTCGFLRISAGDKTNEIPLESRVPSFKWLYYDAYLNQGKQKLDFFSSASTQLDLVIIYENVNNENQTVEDLFTSKQDSAQVLEYRKIDPTKHFVRVDAAKPYVLSFSEAYDSLWTVHVDGTRKDKIANDNNNIPLYSVVNGFPINSTGVHTLSIEYKPQNWFYLGAIVSLITIFAIPIAYILTIKWQRTVSLVRRVKSRIRVK